MLTEMSFSDDWDEFCVIGGIFCCVVAVGLFIWSLTYHSTIEALKSAIRVRQLQDLAPLFIDPIYIDDEKKVLPLVEVSGRVGSYSTPIESKYSYLKGVIMNKEKVLHYRSRDKEGVWRRDQSRLSSKWKEVPWYLDDGTGRVIVCDALHAVSLETMVTNQAFENSDEYGKPDLEIIRVEKTERILPIGTSLTVVGEAVEYRSNGTIRIQKPRKGPFYVSGRSVVQLIEYIQHYSRLLKIISAVLAVVATCLFVAHAYR